MTNRARVSILAAGCILLGVVSACSKSQSDPSPAANTNNVPAAPIVPNLAGSWNLTATSDFHCSEVPTFPGVAQPTCRPTPIKSLSLTQSGTSLSGGLTPNVDFEPTGFVTFALTGSIDAGRQPATVRFTTGDQPVAALQDDTLSYSFEGETNASGKMMTGTLTEVRKFPTVIMNPGGGLYCGSREPIVICPPETRSSTSTFSLP